jgi:hypothetical protein
MLKLFLFPFPSAYLHHCLGKVSLYTVLSSVHSEVPGFSAFHLSQLLGSQMVCLLQSHQFVTYSGFSIHDGTLLHSKSQYTTVKHSRQLLEHTYTSDPQGLGTTTHMEFFQQDLLWQSSNTHSNSCSLKLPNTRRDNPSSGYRSTFTPQRQLGVQSIINLSFISPVSPSPNECH